MSEKRFTTVSIGMEEAYCDFSIIKVGDKIISDGIPTTDAIGICDLLNEQEQKIQRWKNLYEIKDAEVTARVDALNKVCEYYTSEVLFKSDTDPNRAVKEVLNEILNTEVKK